jgi:hypothetical protein
MIMVSGDMTMRNWSAIPAPAVAVPKITTFACGGGYAFSHLSEPVSVNSARRAVMPMSALCEP